MIAITAYTHTHTHILHMRMHISCYCCCTGTHQRWNDSRWMLSSAFHSAHLSLRTDSSSSGAPRCDNARYEKTCKTASVCVYVFMCAGMKRVVKISNFLQQLQMHSSIKQLTHLYIYTHTHTLIHVDMWTYRSMSICMW